MIKVLLTTASFQDVPGEHHQLIESEGYEIIREKGPLKEAKMLDLVGDVDAILCGDDEITARVIEKSLPRLKVISKYGIGVDKIDVERASALSIPIAYCPGVNHTTVAEHCFLLILALCKNLVAEVNLTRSGVWRRLTGHEIWGKTIGIVGVGRIGKEVIIRARAFGLKVIAHDIYWDNEFATRNEVEQIKEIDELFKRSDIITLHTNLTNATKHLINDSSLSLMKKDAIVINCSRGELVNSEQLAEALDKEIIGGYGADVLDEEPPPEDHVLLKAKNCIITPHIGSRTHESVQRQAVMAVTNMINILNGEQPLAQVNDVPVQKVV